MTKNEIHPNDDLWHALENNTPKTFTPDDVKDIVAEVPGENDEFHWWWILEIGEQKYILVDGWCDYTGWDCQSYITEFPICATALAAAELAPDVEEYSQRAIRPNLVAQLNGEYPKFTYWGKKE